jgi:heme exporter protein C
MAATVVAAFLYAPLAAKLGPYTRILYFHVPAAWVSVVAFGAAAWSAARYLATRDPAHDARSAAAGRLGLAFTVLATVTGSIWAKAMWGAFWNWDPRQVSIFFLILIYGAYLTLRAAIADSDRRGRAAAVYALLAFVTVPFLVFVAPRMAAFTLHPEPILNRAGSLEMHPRMALVLASSALAHTVLFFWLWRVESRALTARRRAGARQEPLKEIRVERVAGA